MRNKELNVLKLKPARKSFFFEQKNKFNFKIYNKKLYLLIEHVYNDFFNYEVL